MMRPFELSDDPIRAKDLAVLRAIEQHCAESGGPGPSLTELTARLGLRSVTAVRLRVHDLARRGLVTYGQGQGGRVKPNTLRLTSDGRDQLELHRRM